jgi:hypothetical protein
MRMVIEGFERPLLIQWERVMNEDDYFSFARSIRTSLTFPG